MLQMATPHKVPKVCNNTSVLTSPPNSVFFLGSVHLLINFEHLSYYQFHQNFSACLLEAEI